MKLPLLTLALLPGTLSAQLGAVVREVKINEAHGGFTGNLERNEEFAAALTDLGDLDGDGIGDLAVGAPYDDEGGVARGAVWILRLNADGTVKASTKICQGSGGFAGTLVDQAYFGFVLERLSDLDGDGRDELVVSAERPTRVFVLHLDPSGNVGTQSELLATDPVFAGQTEAADFRRGGIADLGDLDGDGIPDLAWGAPEDDGGFVNAGALWLVTLQANGAAKDARRIGMGSGGFAGVLDVNAYFGRSLEPLGDVDGDGVSDLGVLDPAGDPYGHFWTLFLDASETVRAHGAIDNFEVDLEWSTGTGEAYPGIGHDFARVGDLDGDGIAEVALGTPGYAGSGALALLFLDASGGLRKRLPLTPGKNGLGLDPARRSFGYSVARLGDLDGDGRVEIAVGDPSDSETGRRTGALWILSLATSAVRNGSGANPVLLGQSEEPALGRTWTPTLDCSADTSGVARLFGAAAARAGTFVPAGELLIGGERLFTLTTLHAGAPSSFSAAVPVDLALMNLELHAQGLCTGGVPRLSNALAGLVGH